MKLCSRLVVMIAMPLAEAGGFLRLGVSLVMQLS